MRKGLIDALKISSVVFVLFWAAAASYFAYKHRPLPDPGPSIAFTDANKVPYMTLGADGRIILRGEVVGSDPAIAAFVSERMKPAASPTPEPTRPNAADFKKRERRKFPPGDRD